MTAITANLVSELRKKTGAGMMECKKALTEAQGDIQTAIENMEKAGLAKAKQKAGRTAAEGTIVAVLKGSRGVLLEVNSETDFVAKQPTFQAFAKAAAMRALGDLGPDESVNALLQLPLANDETVDAQRLNLISQMGENISLRRITLFSSEENLAVYGHGDANGTRIGAMVELKGGSPELARDLAMQVAAMNPEYCQTSDIPAERLSKERDILREQTLEQLKAEGKSLDKLDMIVDGKVNKFSKEVTLLGQAFVKDPSITVEALLKKANAQVLRFVRYEVGEGIEKKADNFVEEVMAQARGA